MSIENLGNLQSILESGDVRRWHTIASLKQDVGKHSWGVATILALWHPHPSADLIRAALLHDCHEKEFGDIPSPTKRRVPELVEHEEVYELFFFDQLGMSSPYNNLIASDFVWLDWADKLEAFLFLKRERINGNCNEAVTRAIAAYETLVDEAWDEVLKHTPVVGKPWAKRN
jgi:5'-deoxynucleotidase YfbR-like HD superfamily hydrolase